MGKNKSSAVRKPDPTTMEEIPQELQELVGDGAQVEVSASEGGEVKTETAAPADTNKIALKFNLSALMNEHKTKSAVIRFLTKEGFKTNEIAKFMSIRYQHVRNVLHTPAKRASEPSTPATNQAS
ncbi:MAG: hypothetical protein AB7L09_21530 [Nitrospira sp.]